MVSLANNKKLAVRSRVLVVVNRLDCNLEEHAPSVSDDGNDLDGDCVVIRTIRQV